MRSGDHYDDRGSDFAFFLCSLNEPFGRKKLTN
jgi:hypothetical protein